MPLSPKHSVLASTLLLLTPFTLAQQAPGPPACGAPTYSMPRNRLPTTRPTPEQLQATADVETQDPSVLTVAEASNFDFARYRLLDYYDCVGSSGCYWSDIDAQDRRADAELMRLLAEHNATTPEAARAQRLAIVLDIDETSLSSYCEEKREDLGYIPSMYDDWVISAEAAVPIPGTVRLFNHARAAGLSVFFITGRSGKGTAHDQTEATARNLAAAGYKDWQGLMMHDASYTTKDTTTFKSQVRAGLIAQGYRLILNVGDQWSDLMDPPAAPGEPARPSARAEISVKLPNPFYYLP